MHGPINIKLRLRKCYIKGRKERLKDITVLSWILTVFNITFHKYILPTSVTNKQVMPTIPPPPCKESGGGSRLIKQK